MFIFGILSTPLPYLLIAFAYLMGLGMGAFHKQHKAFSEEELSSNILNYEVLNPETESTENQALYHDFIQDNRFQPDVSNSFYRLFSNQTQPLIKRPPGNQFICHQYLPFSNLFNRPPPVQS